ncbi:MAG: hypothetical protein KGH94_04450 [Candidatus Micrarchaeota archaeon]|nr:hypothetical protein [Candidatus Micrarchaeota archaeon]
MYRSGLLLILLSGVIILPAAAAQSCYKISQFAVPQYVNITLNGVKFMERMNFIGPNSAGVTINENASYTLYPNQSQVIWRTPNYTYTTELVAISWLPVEHSANLTLCSTPNAPALQNSTSTTISTTVSSTILPTSTIPAAANSPITASQIQPQAKAQSGFLQLIISWLSNLFGWH